MSEIRAIETHYKGYRFRSRLEARWAVFFDALGLSWNYEPEGYVLPSGDLYLPDFYINDCEIFVEIKGGFPSESEFNKCRELADGTGKAVLLTYGMPYENPSYLNCWDMSDGSAGSSQWWVTFGYPRSCATWIICHDRISEDRDLFLNTEFGNMIYNRTYEQFSPINEISLAYEKAIIAARSARFEHGERG